MPKISVRDASVLAYLARHGKTSARADRYTLSLTGEAKTVAKALTGRKVSSKSAVKAARGLQKWASDNNKIARTKKSVRAGS
jgi:hypothetical protein